MDKTSRALIGVEDNAESIRALKTRMNENIDALNVRMNESIDELSARVDENIDALNACVNENIDELNSRIVSAESVLGKLKIQYVIGQYKVINGKSNSWFGKYRIDGPTVFVIAPGDLAGRDLYFADKIVLSGTGTLILALNSGEGELRIHANATSPRMLVIGDATKIE